MWNFADSLGKLGEEGGGEGRRKKEEEERRKKKNNKRKKKKKRGSPFYIYKLPIDRPRGCYVSIIVVYYYILREVAALPEDTSCEG